MKNHFAVVTQSLTNVPSRRDVLRGLGGAGLGLGVARFPSEAAAKKQRKKKPKSRKGLCRKDGSPCKKPGKQCKQQFCLKAPFTIAAKWTVDSDHDTDLFVPPENAMTGPSPFIEYNCSPSNSPTCAEEYPFACVSGDATGPGDEVTTIHQLLPGNYEYWIELDVNTPAGEVTVVLKNATGRVVREWSNPANATSDQAGWHVFDISGDDGRVATIDEVIAGVLPQAAHDPATDVCP